MNRQQVPKVVHERVLRNRVIPITVGQVQERGQASSSREPSVEPQKPTAPEVNPGVVPLPAFNPPPVLDEPRSKGQKRPPSPLWQGEKANHTSSTFYDLQDGSERREDVETNIFPDPRAGVNSPQTTEKQERPLNEMEGQRSNNEKLPPSRMDYEERRPSLDRLAETVRTPEYHLQLIATTVRQSVQAVLDRESTTTRETSRMAVPSSLRPPPMFNGVGAKNWLLQIENYHELTGVPMSMRVADAVSYLTDRALSEYALERERGRLPRDWSEFRQWVCTRFQVQSESETVRRLMGLEWDGSLDRLCTKFMAILDEGTAPADHELVRLFIRALSPELALLLGTKPFGSWVEVRDYLSERMAPTGGWATLWMASVPEHRLRDAERRLPQHFAMNPLARHWRSQTHGPRSDERMYGVQRPAASAIMDRSPDVKTNGNYNQAPSANTNFNSSNVYKPETITCPTCKGLGHVKAQCPNAIPQYSKEGAKCSRCRGIGHWAKYCPSPVMASVHMVHTPIKDNLRSEKGKGPGPRNPNESGNGLA